MDWEEEGERLLRPAIATGDVTGWFDELYTALRVTGVGDLKRSLVCVVRPGCGVRRRTGLDRGPMIT